MNDLDHDKTGSRFIKYIPYLFFSFFALLVYMPSFLMEYAFHNDYSMLLADQRGWFDFVEARYLVRMGRILGAMLASMQCWYLTEIADFAHLRFLSFIFSLSTVVCYGYYLRKRCHLENFWIAIIAFSILILPSSQVYTLWITISCPGSLNIFLAACAYLLMDKVFDG